MLEKSRNAVFFNVLCVSAGSKSNLAKGTQEKLHAAVARSTF